MNELAIIVAVAAAAAAADDDDDHVCIAGCDLCVAESLERHS